VGKLDSAWLVAFTLKEQGYLRTCYRAVNCKGLLAGGVEKLAVEPLSNLVGIIFSCALELQHFLPVTSGLFLGSRFIVLNA